MTYYLNNEESQQQGANQGGKKLYDASRNRWVGSGGNGMAHQGEVYPEPDERWSAKEDVHVRYNNIGQQQHSTSFDNGYNNMNGYNYGYHGVGVYESTANPPHYADPGSRGMYG